MACVIEAPKAPAGDIPPDVGICRSCGKTCCNCEMCRAAKDDRAGICGPCLRKEKK